MSTAGVLPVGLLWWGSILVSALRYSFCHKQQLSVPASSTLLLCVEKKHLHGDRRTTNNLIFHPYLQYVVAVKVLWSLKARGCSCNIIGLQIGEYIFTHCMEGYSRSPCCRWKALLWDQPALKHKHWPEYRCLDGFRSAASHLHSLKAFCCRRVWCESVCPHPRVSTSAWETPHGLPVASPKQTDHRAEWWEGKWSSRGTLTSSGQQPASVRKHMVPNHRRRKTDRKDRDAASDWHGTLPAEACCS